MHDLKKTVTLEENCEEIRLQVPVLQALCKRVLLLQPNCKINEDKIPLLNRDSNTRPFSYQASALTLARSKVLPFEALILQSFLSGIRTVSPKSPTIYNAQYHANERIVSQI